MSHTLDEDFANFLCYQNWNGLSWATKRLLKIAYEHGSKRGEPKWVSPDDYLPEMGKAVLASYSPGRDVHELVRFTPGGYSGLGYWIGSDGNSFTPPKYWMSLPAAPKP